MQKNVLLFALFHEQMKTEYRVAVLNSDYV